IVGHVDERIEEMPEDGGSGDRVVVGGIEGEHALGEPGRDLAAALGLTGGQTRRARESEGSAACGEEIAAADGGGARVLLGHACAPCWCCSSRHKAQERPRGWGQPRPGWTPCKSSGGLLSSTARVILQSP